MVQRSAESLRYSRSQFREDLEKPYFRKCSSEGPHVFEVPCVAIRSFRGTLNGAKTEQREGPLERHPNFLRFLKRPYF
jgi:hypothetical protein